MTAGCPDAGGCQQRLQVKEEPYNSWKTPSLNGNVSSLGTATSTQPEETLSVEPRGSSGAEVRGTYHRTWACVGPLWGGLKEAGLWTRLDAVEK